MSDGKKIFDFHELHQQKDGRFVHNTAFIDDFTTIKGLAARGTLESQPAWVIWRELVTLGQVLTFEFLDNADFTQVWDDYGTLFFGSGTGGVRNLFMQPIRLHDEDGQPYTGVNPVPTSGEFTTSGLSIGMRTSVVSASDTVIGLPAVAFASRNNIVLRNLDAANTVFIDDANTVTSSGANQGWRLLPESDLTLDITDAIGLFGICDTGLTATVEILEIA